MQMTSPSHPHTQARVQPRNVYNHTYRSFCLAKTKQSHTKSRQNNLHSVHAGPCIIYEQYRPKNTQQCNIQDNAPKGSGSYLRPKTHIQHTHPQHLRVPKTTAYKRWNCQVMRPANCCPLIPSNRFLDGFPVPSQFAAAKLTHYSTIPHRPSDSSGSRQRLLLSGDMHQNPGPATKYPCSVCISNVTNISDETTTGHSVTAPLRPM